MCRKKRTQTDEQRGVKKVKEGIKREWKQKQKQTRGRKKREEGEARTGESVRILINTLTAG